VWSEVGPSGQQAACTAGGMGLCGCAAGSSSSIMRQAKCL
jgi:hypothetical protein